MTDLAILADRLERAQRTDRDTLTRTAAYVAARLRDMAHPGQSLQSTGVVSSSVTTPPDAEPAPGATLLSASAIIERSNCEWRYWFGREFSPVERYRPPDLGTAVHLLIEQYLKGKDQSVAFHQWLETQRIELEKWEELAPESVEEGFEKLAEVELLAPAIMNRWNGWWCDGRFYVLDDKVEWKNVLRTAQYDLGFTVDALVMDNEIGRPVVLDWKVRQQFLPQESEEFNIQAGIYQWAGQQLGLDIAGSAIVQIYPGIPATPDINKVDGRVSRKKIRTDWETYKSVVESIGHDPSDYEDMRVKIESAQWEWFKVNRAYRSPAELDGIESRIIRPTIRRIRQLEQGETPIRALSPARCIHCWARMACMETLRGADIDDVSFAYERNEDGRYADSQDDDQDPTTE